MKIFFRLTSVVFFVFAILYALIYYSFYLKINELNLSQNKSVFVSSTSSTLSFNKVSPYISPLKIGIKVTGLSEKIKNSLITHDAPLYIDFNPWTFKIQTYYNGKSFVTSNLDNSDSLVIDSDISLTLNMYLDFKTLAFLLKSQPIKLISYIKSTTLEYKHLKVYSNKIKSNIFTATDTNFTLITKPNNYKSLSDIISNPPKFYSLSGIVNIENSTNKKYLAPFSLIYGIVPNFDVKGAFFVEIDSAEKVFNFEKPFDNAKTRFICKKCKSSKLDLTINSYFDSTSSDIKIDFASDILIKKPFFADPPIWYSKILKGIKGFDKEAFTILSSPDKYLPPIDFSSMFTLKTNSVLDIKDHSIKASINNLILKSSSGSGISLNGKADLNSNLQYNLDGNIVLKNANSFIKYWGEYYYRKINHLKDDEKDIIDFNTEVISSTAKQISEYPDSVSDDFLYTVVINSKDNKYLVCNKSLTDLTFTYYKVKTQKLLDKASESKDPLKFILRVTPELSSVADELLKELPEKKEISKELWKKLVE